jgi:hypothetical protein
MNWWRAHHGIATDPKYAVVMRYLALHRVTFVTPVTRAEILAIWVWAIDYSSQQEERGSVDGIDPSQVAVTLDITDEKVIGVLSAFESVGMISCNSLTAWMKRQPKREDDSSNRVRQYRENKKHDVTHGNAELHSETPSDDVTPSRVRPRVLLSSSLSSSNNRSSVEESSGEDWFEEIYKRHPKKKDRGLAESNLSQSASKPDFNRAEFDRVHILWCEEWSKDKPQFAPSLAQWILDQGWRYPPVNGSCGRSNYPTVPKYEQRPGDEPV